MLTARARKFAIPDRLHTVVLQSAIIGGLAIVSMGLAFLSNRTPSPAPYGTVAGFPATVKTAPQKRMNPALTRKPVVSIRATQPLDRHRHGVPDRVAVGLAGTVR